MAPAHFKRACFFCDIPHSFLQTLISREPSKELSPAPSYQHFTQQMDPLVDGYLTNMFGSADAEAYYSNLLKRETRLLRPYNLPNYPGIFFAAPPLRPDLNPTPPQTPWVIDYAVRNWGTVIKQQIWVTRNQHEFLRPPIFFVHKNGGLGLPLIQAARGDCMSLNGASSRAPLDAASSTHAQIRIHVSFVPVSRMIDLNSNIHLQVARLSRMGRPNFDSDPSARAGNRQTREIRDARSPESVQVHD